MTLIAWLIIIFTIIQMTVALTNLMVERNLPESDERSGDLVSVLIPARNEENNIVNILTDLINQDHENVEIIVFNDQSEDNTAAIVNSFIEKDKRITLINSEGLPEGWLGKNYACHKLSENATGKYLLFLDADVRVGNKLLDNAVSFTRKHNTGLISIFPKQIIISLGEKITVPNMNFILVTLLPLILVRKSRFPSLAAANGQFMFFRSDIYRIIHPHKLMKGNMIEDISIAREFKKQGIKIACLLGDDKITCRMYRGFHEAVNGFSKNVIEFFGGSFIMALLFWLVTTFGFAVILFTLSPVFLYVYLTIYLLTRIFVSAASSQNICVNIVFILPLQLSLGLFIYKAFINKNFRKFQWKGREIK
ncbi:MAG: glycosyl transferase family 2 [Bacteroidetes bacterium]|nr:glycosyl transferase family 2 [Bacteroidota bacterium]